MRYAAVCTVVAIALLFSTHQAIPENIPQSQVTTLDGQAVTIPAGDSLKPIVLVLGFSNKSSDDVTAWNKHFKVHYASDPRVNFYELADFQGVPSLIMRMILHGMRRSVQEPERAHFAPFYSQEDQWKQLVKFDNPNISYILLANSKGAVLWQAPGPASDETAAALETEIGKITSEKK